MGKKLNYLVIFIQKTFSFYLYSKKKYMHSMWIVFMLFVEINHIVPKSFIFDSYTTTITALNISEANCCANQHRYSGGSIID